MQTDLLSGHDEVFESISGLSLFSSVSVDKIKVMLGNSELVKVEPDEIIFHRGDSYHKGVYLVMKGQLMLSSESGNTIITGPGDIVGLSSFVGKSTYGVTVTAEEPSELVFVPELCVYKLMEDFDEFRKLFYSMVTERIQNLNGNNTPSVASSTYKPVGSYMTSPVNTVDKGTSIIEASRIMTESKIGSLVVVDEAGSLCGVITSRLIVHNFLSDIENNLKKPAIENYMLSTPVSLPSEFPLVEALAEMQFKKQEYAIVVRDDKPVGIISNNDISRIIFRNSNVFSTYIDNVHTVEELAVSFSNLFKITESLVSTTRVSYEVLPVISSVHLNIQKKVYKITADQYFKETGFDISKVCHTLMIMGSGGRREMMLDPDQDNGIIFADEVTDEEIEQFKGFSELFVSNLEKVGYPRCNGDVMATNPKMARRLTEWMNMIASWVNNPGSTGIMWSSIIFDFDGLAGDEKMVWQLRDFINRIISEKPIFLIQSLERDAHLKKPVSMWGKFQVDKDGENKGKMNIKYAAMAILVDVTRAFTLNAGLSDLNTIERLKHLRRKNILSDDTVVAVREAYESIVDILLNEQIKMANKGEEVSKTINPNELSTYNQEKLKKALSQVPKFLNNGLRYLKGHPW